MAELRIIKGNKPMWEAVHGGRTIGALRYALYTSMCQCQELESAIEKCMGRIERLERRISDLDDPFPPHREP